MSRYKAQHDADPDTPLILLGGLTPKQFMQRYWQKRPLLVRQAFPDIKPPVSAAQLKKLARRDDVQSRLIMRRNDKWRLSHGPMSRLPSNQQPDWTLLIQSLDIHDDQASDLLHQFNFLPAARLDDLMASIATIGGGVGPHFDSYDVFLIQAQGVRQWRYGMQKDLSLMPGLPLKILSRFEPEHEVDLQPGDMLYLPPQAAHDGIAKTNDCMTLSVGFRAPDLASLAQGMLEAAAEQIAAREHGGGGTMADPPLPGPRLDARFRDPMQPATRTPGDLPDALVDATVKAAQRIALDHALAERYLGCWLTEPNSMAFFESTSELTQWPGEAELRLDRRSRMLYKGSSLFINGELAPVKANAILKEIANRRSVTLTHLQYQQLSHDTQMILLDWIAYGWLHWQPRQKHAN
jgi:50S ribosomal protein L16 3-hydroxylase